MTCVGYFFRQQAAQIQIFVSFMLQIYENYGFHAANRRTLEFELAQVYVTFMTLNVSSQ